MAAKRKRVAKKKAAKRPAHSSAHNLGTKKGKPKRKAPASRKTVDTMGRTITDAQRAAQFKPGESGNPKGRPKGKTWDEAMTVFLAGLLEKDPKQRTRLEAAVEIAFSEAFTKRNAKIMVAIMDRLWPKPLKIQGNPEAPIVVETREKRDLSQLSTVELKVWRKLMRKAAGGGA